MNRLEALTPGSHANYRAAGTLDGHKADIFASNVCGDRISLHIGPLGMTVSFEACCELVEHLTAAIDAQLKAAGGADHE